MMKNFTELKRFDFTPECKSCQYKKDLGLMEYCCSFVVDLYYKEKLNKMKETVYDYLYNEDDFDIIDSSNMFFEKDDVYTVTLTFKTNLREDKMLILKELRRTILDSMYFTSINFIRGSLTKEELGKEPIILRSRIDEFLDSRVDAK